MNELSKASDESPLAYEPDGHDLLHSLAHPHEETAVESAAAMLHTIASEADDPRWTDMTTSYREERIRYVKPLILQCRHLASIIDRLTVEAEDSAS